MDQLEIRMYKGRIENGVLVFAIVNIILTSLLFPFITPFLFALFIITSIFFYNTTLNIILLILSLIFSLFTWSYIGVSIHIYELNYSRYLIILRALALGYITYFIFIFLIRSIRLNFAIKALSFLVFFSFLKADDKITALKYLINTYIPLLLTFIFFHNIKNIKFKYLEKYIKYSHLIYITVASIIIIDCIFIILDKINLISLKDFYIEVANLFREGGMGNFRTIIFNKLLERTPGIFADPIVAAYFLSLCFFFVLIYSKSLIKYPLLFIILILLFVTFSKAGYIMLFLGILGLFIHKIIKYSKLKIAFILSLYTLILFIVIIRALYWDVTDSSRIHVLGLILPFLQPIDLNFFIGNDMGSGGNLGGGLNEGAESFVGLLMYNLGLLGVLLYIYLFSKVIISAFLAYNSKLNAFIIASIIPMFWTSFLQENVFNLAYSVPRIIMLIFVIILEAKKYGLK